MTNETKTTDLSRYDPSHYAKRGNIHDLEYYDGPLLSAQMCRTKQNTPVIEIGIDSRAAETDGFTVYTRVTRKDLQTMLRMFDDPVAETPARCLMYSAMYQGSCPTCAPPQEEEAVQGFWVVVDEEATDKRRLSIHGSSDKAVEWIREQTDTEKVARGGYGIDGPCESLDL